MDFFSNHGDKATCSRGMAVYPNCLNNYASLDFIQPQCHKRTIAPFKNRAVCKCVQCTSEEERVMRVMVLLIEEQKLAAVSCQSGSKCTVQVSVRQLINSAASHHQGKSCLLFLN